MAGLLIHARSQYTQYMHAHTHTHFTVQGDLERAEERASTMEAKCSEFEARTEEAERKVRNIGHAEAAFEKVRCGL